MRPPEEADAVTYRYTKLRTVYVRARAFPLPPGVLQVRLPRQFELVEFLEPLTVRLGVARRSEDDRL
jgi:hypothetical protein